MLICFKLDRCSYSDGETKKVLVSEEAAKAFCNPKTLLSVHFCLQFLIILIAILQGKCMCKYVCILKPVLWKYIEFMVDMQIYQAKIFWGNFFSLQRQI